MSSVFAAIAQKTAQSRSAASRRQSSRNRTPLAGAESSQTQGDSIQNATSAGTTPAEPSARKRKRNAVMNLKYCEYNLSTMKDTKGGFLVPDTEQGDGSAEKQVPQKKIVYEMPPSLDDSENPRCEKCTTIDIDTNYEKYFDVFVCRNCIKEYPDDYSLLTKTETRQDYLLTESELRDASKLPVWERPNPHKSTYSNMMLYLRKQVESFACEKWGSLEALDEEFEKREQVKSERKAKKFKTKLAELRKKTFTRTWMEKRQEEASRESQTHEHEYETLEQEEADDPLVTKQKCTICGFEISFETF